jgi:hypothetical protein
VLESIRDLLNEAAAIPPWLADIFLGYGDPGAAHYANMEGALATVDFRVRVLGGGFGGSFSGGSFRGRFGRLGGRTAQAWRARCRRWTSGWGCFEMGGGWGTFGW